MSEQSARGSDVLGPVQVLLIGIGKPDADQMVSAELQDLGNQSAIEVVDLARVRRGLDGEVRRLDVGERTDLSGALVEALLFAEPGEFQPPLDGIGSRTAGAWFLAERIPRGAAAAVLLLEHRWAIPLREAAAELEAEIFGDAWVHPRDLLAAEQAARQSRG